MPTTVLTKTHDLAHWDQRTGGAFSASTSGERSQRIKDWLASNPSHDDIAEVYKELSARDKGAAKVLRERLDDAKRSKAQEAIAFEWAAKAQALLDVSKLNMADALAWQRDAAKAGAPLSREPLAGLKAQLVERVRVIEDLQHQAQVQRESAVLLAQRIEVLSTKPWQDAQALVEALGVDVQQWQSQASALMANPQWLSVDMKFAPILDAARAQLLLVWEAFQAAVAQAVAAAADPQAPLPAVGVWAEALRNARAVSAAPPKAPKAPKVAIDPLVREQAQGKVGHALAELEAQVGQGHGKASAGAANALRLALKEYGKLIDAKLEHQAQLALGAAGELEGWQRWRADQLREALVIKAEGLLKRPEGQALGGRKLQETLRAMREEWKQTDQGGVPNHAMWKRFDEACNQAHKVVEAWLDKLKAEAQANRQLRLALLEELKAWAEANRTALDNDWKGFTRLLHQFAERWRNAGHLGEKAFAELQPQWKAAMAHAAEPLETLQTQSIALRQAMIEEAKVLGASALLRIDAVKALQQRWQAQAHAVPLDRRLEQKLWDAFRKPIDEAFQRKTREREVAEASLGLRDRAVMEASKALQKANAGGDAQAIRAAMAALEMALKGQAQARAEVSDAGAREAQAQSAAQSTEGAPSAETALPEADASDALAADGARNAEPSSSEETAHAAPAQNEVPEPPPAPAPAKAAPKPVVAMRGDDRPGMRKDSPSAAPRGGKWGDRKDSGRSAPPGRDGRDARSGEGARGRGAPERFPREERDTGPRLGDAAFRAQRDALENAQSALKKLAAQAHGEALTHLLSAWEQRDAGLVPSAQDLGARINAAARNAWVGALSVPAGQANPQSLLRLEMAADIPTAAEHLDARRALQLQLLTRRNDPSPQQTWVQDAAQVIAGPFAAGDARRLQNALKTLLRR